MFKKYVEENNLGIVKESSFKEITTIGCGGIIKNLYIPSNINNLKKAFKYINDFNLGYIVVGGGSNILAGDKEYDGIVIYLKGLESSDFMILNNKLYVSGFFPTSKLAYILDSYGYNNLSFLYGIPGFIGGAIHNNSGAFDNCIGNYIDRIYYIDKDGKLKSKDRDVCYFSYRRSSFSYMNVIITKVVIDLSNDNNKLSIKDVKKYRLNTQPQGVKCMGSIFKNNPLIKVWRVVDALGLRGFNINDAFVSKKHSNFIINTKNCSSEDIINIINLIQTRAKLELGIILVLEINILNY